MAKILVVDDSELMRDILARHISLNSDHEILTATNGEEAVERALGASPDLVLMDLIMPGMDGITAIRRIRAVPRNADLPIIFLSAETDRRKWVEAFEAGANDFISKPYQKNELLARIESHLKIASLTRELRLKNSLMERERYLASLVQRQLLPQNLDFRGFEISAVYQAQEQIGGDFYDAWEQDDAVCFVMADISGHGASSALLMAVCKGLAYTLGKENRSPDELVAEMNRLLMRMLDEGDLDMFVTMAFAKVDRRANDLTLVSAGHAPVFLAPRDGPCEKLEATGPALGFVPEFEWGVVRRPFHPGDALFLLTDGLLELRSPAGEFFGEERVMRLLRPGVPPKEWIGEIIDLALPFCKGVMSDDLAMLAALRTA